jgi:hypothetical protein
MRQEAVESFEYKGLTINIYQDESYDQSPDEWGNEDLFLVGFHSDFTVRREGFEEYVAAQAYADRDKYTDLDDDQAAHVKQVKKKYWIIGLEAYIHSGVVLAIAREGNFPDRRWDVSQLGAIFVEKKTWKTLPKARKAALGLIEEWNSCLSGEVYGYVVEGKGVDEIKNAMDSCWGFLGDIKYCIEEAKSTADWYAKEIRERRQKLVKALIRNKVPLKDRVAKL